MKGTEDESRTHEERTRACSYYSSARWDAIIIVVLTIWRRNLKWLYNGKPQSSVSVHPLGAVLRVILNPKMVSCHLQDPHQVCHPLSSLFNMGKLSIKHSVAERRIVEALHHQRNRLRDCALHTTVVLAA